MSGMAPRARVAVYKAVWGGESSVGDVMAAVEQAVRDGVDGHLPLPLPPSPPLPFSPLSSLLFVPLLPTTSHPVLVRVGESSVGDVMAAVEQAVRDGIDVLLLPIGSTDDDYFNSAFLLRAVQ
ncbi:unnamed protein product, partial [Closterium sp. Naga37s-1]